MKDMMAIAAERVAKVLGKVVPVAAKPDKRDSADEEGARVASSAGGKKERNRD